MALAVEANVKAFCNVLKLAVIKDAMAPVPGLANFVKSLLAGVIGGLCLPFPVIQTGPFCWWGRQIPLCGLLSERGQGTHLCMVSLPAMGAGLPFEVGVANECGLIEAWLQAGPVQLSCQV